MGNQTQDASVGSAQPAPSEDQLGEDTFGDEKADNHEYAKNVDYPEHSDDINADISSGDERTTGADR